MEADFASLFMADLRGADQVGSGVQRSIVTSMAEHKNSKQEVMLR